MTLLIVVCTLTYSFQRAIANDPSAWDRAGSHRRLGRLLGSVSIFFWVGIIVAGRLIAYV